MAQETGLFNIDWFTSITSSQQQICRRERKAGTCNINHLSSRLAMADVVYISNYWTANILRISLRILSPSSIPTPRAELIEDRFALS